MEPAAHGATRMGASDANRILEVSLSLAESLNLDTVLAHAVSGAVELLEADTGAIYLVDGDDLVLGATVPPTDLSDLPPEAIRSRADQSPQILNTLRTLAPHAIAQTDTVALDPYEREMMELRGIESILYVPVVHDGVAVGIMMVGNGAPPREYNEGDIYVARALSAEVGLAITNARLYRESEQSAREMADLAGFSEAVFEASPAGIVVVSEAGQIVLANQSAADMLGATRDSLLETNVYNLPNWHRIGLISLIERVVTDRYAATFEYEGETSWGRSVCVEIQLSPFQRTGESQVVLMINDVTARRNAENALRDSEEHYRLLADNSADIIWIFDIDTLRLTYVTPSVERLLGYTPDEMQAMPLEELLAPESMRVVNTMLMTARDTYRSGDHMAVRTVELEMVQRSGNIVVTETVTRFLPSEDELPHAILGTVRDITERKESDRALRRRAEFDGIFSDILVELAAFDADHIDDAVNGALERVAKFLGADGAFIFAIHGDGQSGSINHYWREGGAPDGGLQVRDVPLDALDSIAATLFQNEPVAVSSIDDFPEDALADRALHRLLGAESALEVPMRGRHGAVVGAVGLTSSEAGVKWGEEELRLAKLLGSAIANSFERQAAERAQRAAASDWIQTFEAAGDGIAVVELGARIRRLNDAMAERFGRTSSECEGEYCSMLRGCAEELVGACPHSAALTSGRPQSAELYDMSTGRTYLVTSSPLQDTDGVMTGTVCISHDITEMKEYDAQMRQLAEEVSLGQLATIFALAKLAESRDDSTGRHIECVQELCRVIAYEMQDMEEFASTVDDAFISRLAAAAPLHDVGKVGVPDSILLKPGPLTTDEFDLVKTHSVIGANTLSAVRAQHPNNEFVAMGVDIARYHHEWWDGRGYPEGLIGEDIPLAARIMAVADVYEALRSDRAYKSAFTHVESVEIIRDEIGTHFDPKVGEAFLRCAAKLEVAWDALRG